jgi:2-keto-4-pentenoate hydratase
VLWQQRQDGTVIDALPLALCPQDHAQGHAIQAELPRVAGQAVIGWKIAATSVAGQQHINVSGPLAGRILSGFVFDPNVPLSLTGNRMRVAEPEFAFCMGASLAPQTTAYSVADVLAHVASLHPAFEIPDSRYSVFTNVGQAQLIADNACCGVFAFGAAAPNAWRTLDLPTHPVASVVRAADGSTRLTRQGVGAAALGDPRVALTWLVNELSALGVPLEAGQFVSTGTCMQPLAIEPGDQVEADYGVLGTMSMRLMGHG